MILDYVGVKEINGSLIVLDGVKDASFEEMVDIRLDDGSSRHGRIVQIDGEPCSFAGNNGTSFQRRRCADRRLRRGLS